MRLFILLVILAGIQLVTGQFTEIIGKTCTKDKQCNSISYCWKPEFGFTDGSTIKKIQRCKSMCAMHGENYNYCYVSKKRWDYCTPSKDAGQDPHCILKTYHLLWIGCIIAVFIAICIFYCRKKYQIQSAEVNLGFVKVDVEKIDENPPNNMAADQNEDQNSPYSIEQVEVESNTSGSQILCQTTPLTQSVTYNENPANILAANQNNSSSIKIFHEKTHGSVHEDRKAFNRDF